MSTVQSITQYLRLFIRPGQVTELRAFSGTSIYSGYYDYDHLPHMALAASDLERSTDTKGVYFVPNPIKPDLLSRSPNRVQLAAQTTKDNDICDRRWLLVDVDPVRPADTSSSEAERAHAWQVANNVQSCLSVAGFRSPIIACSGNGWHLSYPVESGADQAARDQFRAILAGLDSRCSSTEAKVDVRTYNAARIWRLYGTHARKGESTDDRPHRVSWVVDGQADDVTAAAVGNSLACAELLASWRRQDELLVTIEERRSEPSLTARARAYLREVPPAVSGAGGHGQTYHAAATLVDGFSLDRETAIQLLSEWNAKCVPPWSEREIVHKVEDAIKNAKSPGRLRDAGATTSKAGQYTGLADLPETTDLTDDPIATAEDLVALQATVQWTWPGWIQRGTLTCLASDPGIGKTRLCADITARIWHGRPWPDGSAPTLPAGSRVLWVASDSQWAELGTLPASFGFPGSAIVLNGRRSNPYAGTNLDSVEDLATLERNIRSASPALVFVDTIGNATERNQGRAEEARAIFKPLAEIATRTNTSIVLVTHLNRGGQVMGNRIIGAVRQVVMLDQPPGAEDHRRRLRVSKTNSQKPAALGVSMGSAGNDYDTDPPQGPDDQPASKSKTRVCHLEADSLWLQGRLHHGARRVSHLIEEGEQSGISVSRLYAVIKKGFAEEFVADGRKFFKLPDDDGLPAVHHAKGGSEPGAAQEVHSL